MACVHAGGALLSAECSFRECILARLPTCQQRLRFRANDSEAERLILLSCLQTSTRQQVLDYFDNTWTLTEVLFSGLQASRTNYPCHF